MKTSQVIGLFFICCCCFVVFIFIKENNNFTANFDVKSSKNIERNLASTEASNLEAKLPVAAGPVPSDVIMGNDVIRRKGVIIFTTMRSGSSFLGEIFNQHSQVFYLFEPLHAFGSRIDQEQWRTSTIDDVMRCNFTAIPARYKEAVEEGHWPDHSARCATDHLCFKDKSRFLSRDTDLCENRCKVPFDPEDLSKICSRSLFPVVKVVAEPSLASFGPIIEDPQIQIKIIHLVRDPRAVMTSLRKMHRMYDATMPYKMKTKSQPLCRNLHDNLEFAELFENNLSENSLKWKENYLRLRFEDISLHPLDSARKVYEFVGLNLDSGMKDWIKKNTKGESGASGFFGTNRNSTEAISHWRNELNFTDINDIQKNCWKSMRILNYKNILKSDDVTNTSLDLWW